MKEKTIDRLLNVVAAVQTSPALDENVKAWFLGGVERFLSGNDGLQQTLGLNGVRYQWLLRQRNARLFDAWRSLDMPDEASEWARCLELARCIRDFEAVTWPRLRDGRDPAHINGTQRHLLLAFKTGLYVPSTGQQVQAIIKSVTGSHLTPNDISYSLSMNHTDKESEHEI